LCHYFQPSRLGQLPLFMTGTPAAAANGLFEALAVDDPTRDSFFAMVACGAAFFIC